MCTLPRNIAFLKIDGKMLNYEREVTGSGKT